MALPCPSCQAENDDAAEVCFNCRHVLVAITRGSVLASRYEILEPIGKGGMGVVYRAHDRELEEVVALKVLRPDIAQSPDVARRFRAEIRLARKVGHRNVCRIFEYGADGALRYIVMEFMEGIDLKRVLRQSGALPADQAFEIAIQVAEGLHAIHELGIVHRDLKTSNIMLDARGVAKLMDFGIAKEVDTDTAGGTATGHIIGTPEYMSPEQARAEKIDFRSDLYALGVVVYELFTGRLPFRGDTPLSTILKHLNDPPPLTGPDAAGIPVPLVPVLARVLAKQAAERFPSTEALVVALQQARAEAIPGAPPARALTAPRPQRMEPVTPTPPPTPTRTRIPPGKGAPLATGNVPPTGGALPSTQVAGPTQLAAAAPTVLGAPSPPRTGAGLLVGVAAAAVVGIGMLLWMLLGPEGNPAPAPVASIAPPTTLPSSTAASAPPPSLAAAGESPAAVPSPGATPEPRPRPSPTPRIPITAPTAAAVPVVTLAPTPAPTVAATPAPTPLPTPTAPPATPPPAPVPVAEDRGFLQLVVVPSADVNIDDKPVGHVRSSKLPLSTGAHVVVLSHPDYEPLRRRVSVVTGETLKVVVDLAEEAVRRKK